MLQIKLANPMHTIQDLGRFGFASQGIAQAGPMDSISACWANRLLQNSVSCPLSKLVVVDLSRNSSKTSTSQ